MTAVARFVDSISETPTVRLDLLSDSWMLTAGTRFDPPAAKRAVGSTLLMDGSIYPASAYEDRVLQLHIAIHGATSDDAAAGIQLLARELDRPMNFFEYRLPGLSNSVFFKTIRLAMESVDHYTDGTDLVVVAPVIAEPFGYGLLETPVEAVTVSTDPAAGSNGCFVDVTGVKGDVEAPAIISWPGVNNHQALFAVRRRGTPSSAPFLIQAEAMTQGTDTTTQTNVANFSGSGNNYSRCTFATATIQNRLSTFTVGTSGVDLRGTYRVLLRYRKNTGSDGINLVLRWADGDETVNIINDTVATFSNASFQFADLGLISFPMGQDPIVDPAGVPLAVSNSLTLRVRAERTSGSGTIDFDFLLLVPADDRLGVVQWRRTGSYVLDAANTPAYRVDTAQISSAAAPVITGGLPMLSPGQTNRVYMLRTVNSNGVANALTTVSPVSVSYMPRYLTIRPAST